MNCYIFSNHISLLRPLVTEWVDSCNCSDFNIDTSVDSLLLSLRNLITFEQSDLMVLSKNNNIVGLMGLRYFNNPLGSGKVAEESYWYVMHDYRGPSSLRLIVLARQLAKENNCTHLIMSASNLASDLHDTVCNMYSKMGMKKFETSYIQEV